ncbi:MAG: hypothetical protein AB7G47_10325 [Mycolicibacterium sp.]|uniref:hypothetical protein n=1 Tax=Mycolicibacterium sp. TaxID=2320850 RepID=UPI003D135C15
MPSPPTAGDVIALLRDAGRIEPDLATLYRDARNRADDIRRDIFSAWSPAVLRLDVTTAVHVYAAVCNIDAYTTLTGECGWLNRPVESWWVHLLQRELLD